MRRVYYAMSSSESSVAPPKKPFDFRGVVCAMTAPLCAVVSGALFALSLPPTNAEPLCWVAFAPVLFAAAVPGRRPLHALGLGLLSGLATGVCRVGWDFAHADKLNYAYLPFIWIALAIGVICALAAWMRPRMTGMRWGLFVACAGVLVEYLTMLSPLPIGIALSQAQSVGVIQIAAVTGIWGVSFLLWWTNAAVADAALRAETVRGWSLARPVLLAAGVAVVNAIAGTIAAPLAERGRTLTVAAIQDYDGIDAGGLNDSGKPLENAPDGPALTRKAVAQGARLVVWSEECLGSGFEPDKATDDTNRIARETGAYIVPGFEQRAMPLSFNCAALVAPSGKTLAIHRKNRLFLGERLNIQAGTGATVAKSPIGAVGMLICFDTCYTDLVRNAVVKGAQIIALPNYDPPTPRAVLHDLHCAFMPFRAVENHVAIVRADPNGKSQIVAPSGRVVAEAGMYEPVALTAPVPMGDGRGTLFTRWGDWFALACSACALTLIGIAFAPMRAARFGER